MITVKDVLLDLKEWFSVPEHFTTGAYARDINGGICSRTGLPPVCFCTVGRVDYFLTIHDADIIKSHIRFDIETAITDTQTYKKWDRTSHEAGVISFNDEAGREQVLMAIDEALEKLTA